MFEDYGYFGEEEQEDQDAHVLEVFGVEKETEKAKFFITDIAENGDKSGAWIPRTVIVSENKTEIVLKEWFHDIKIITWS